MKVRELGGFIRDQRNTARISLRKLSSLTGISNPYLSQIERGLRRPSADILQAIARALRISAETLYVKAGILDERVDGSDPVFEIRRDATLDDHQKQILVELYESFRESALANGARSARKNVKPRKVVKKSAKSSSPAKKPATKKATASKKTGRAKPAAKKSALKKPVVSKKSATKRKTPPSKKTSAATKKTKSVRKTATRKTR